MSEGIDLGVRRELIGRICACLREHTGICERVIMFGSTSRGDYSEDSDIDLIFISENVTTSKIYRSKVLRPLLYELYVIVGDYIEFDILYMGRNELKRFRESSLYGEICKDGIVLYEW